MRRLPKRIDNDSNQEGQALLIVLLTMAVILAVVLSVVSRSITDISTTSFEEESLRAFSAAEAGVEETLRQGAPPPATNLGNASYNVSTSTPSPSGNEFVYPSDLFSGETATFWLVSHDDNDFSLTCSGGKPCLESNKINKLCWGNPGAANDANAPAVEISVIYDEDQGGVNSDNWDSLKVLRKAFDSNAARRASNNFESANYSASGSCTVGGQTFPFSVNDILFTPATFLVPCRGTAGCLIAVKARMLYNNSEGHPIAVDMGATGGTSLPAQGVQIDSTGQAGDSTRRVKVFHSYPELPFAFNSAVFSLRDLIHN